MSENDEIKAALEARATFRKELHTLCEIFRASLSHSDLIAALETEKFIQQMAALSQAGELLQSLTKAAEILNNEPIR